MASLSTPTLESFGLSLPTFPERVYLAESRDKKDIQRYVEEVHDLVHTLLTYTREKSAIDDLNLLVSKFVPLINDSSADVVIETTNEPIRVHGCIVSQWSEPLKLMLASSMQEGRKKIIKCCTEDYSSVMEVFKYCYSANVDINTENVFPILRLACLYQMEPLVSTSLDFLEENVSVENCIEILQFASLNHTSDCEDKWDSLQQTGLQFLRENAEEILDSAHPFRGMDLPFVSEIMLTLSDFDDVAENPLLDWAQEYWETKDIFQLLALSDAIQGNLPSEQASACKVIHSFCLSRIRRDFETQCKLSAFLELEVDNLVFILQDNDLNVSSEREVLEAVVAWIDAYPVERGTDEIVSQLLPLIRFPFLPLELLLELPTSNNALSTCSLFKTLLTEALTFQLSSNKWFPQHLEDNLQIIKRTSYKQVPAVTTAYLVSTLLSLRDTMAQK